MKIGIIGAGNIGGNLTRRLTALGHEVAVANSRGPETLTPGAGDRGQGGFGHRGGAATEISSSLRSPKRTFLTYRQVCSMVSVPMWSSSTPATTIRSSVMVASMTSRMACPKADGSSGNWADR